MTGQLNNSYHSHTELTVDTKVERVRKKRNVFEKAATNSAPMQPIKRMGTKRLAKFVIKIADEKQI